MSPDTVHRQAECLGNDLQRYIVEWHRGAAAALEQTCNTVAGTQVADIEAVWLTGCGDSHHAAMAARATFRQLAGVEAVAVEAATLAGGLPPPELQRLKGRVIVIGVSASGRTPKVVQALAAAQGNGLATVAVCGVVGVPVAQASTATLEVKLPDCEPSPGIRTYQASLLGLTLLALALGERRGRLGNTQLADWLRKIEHLGRTMTGWSVDCRVRCDALATMFCDAPFAFFAAAGRDIGTAHHGAAKLMECAGLLGVAREAEEWWHVERFVDAPAAPLVILAGTAPPALDVAMELASRATKANRRLILVAPEGSAAGFSAVQGRVERLVCPAGVPRVLVPLLFGLPCAMLAASVARALHRNPFLGRH